MLYVSQIKPTGKKDGATGRKSEARRQEGDDVKKCIATWKK